MSTDSKPWRPDPLGALTLSPRIWAGIFFALWCVRFVPPFSHRIILWDDFVHLANNGTLEGFKEYVFSTREHLTPLFHILYAGIRFLPLDSIAYAMTGLIVLGGAWLASGFIRYSRLQGLGEMPILFGLVYLFFNPMLGETWGWFCSFFYALGLAAVLEALIQFEHYLSTESPLRILLTVLFSAAAPMFWTLGYLIAPLLLLTFVMRKPVAKTLPLMAIGFVFLLYPTLKVLSHLFTTGAQGFVPSSLFKALKLTLKIIPDGLVLGSFGAWGDPARPLTFAPHVLNLLAIVLCLGIYRLYRCTDKKNLVLAALGIVAAGFFIPLWGRGDQYPYEVLRSYMRYYTFPVAGGALLVAVWAEQAAHYRKGFLAGALALVIISFATPAIEHANGASSPNSAAIRLDSSQRQQLKFLNEFFALAESENISRSALSEHYFFAITGADFFNGIDLYQGVKTQPLTPQTKQKLDDKLKSANLWPTYQTLPPHPRPNQSHFRENTAAMIPVKFQSLESRAVVRPEAHTDIKRLAFDLESGKSDTYRLQFKYNYIDPNLKPQSVFLNCRQRRCRGEINQEHFVWLAPFAVKKIDILIEHSDDELRVHQLSAEPILFESRT